MKRVPSSRPTQFFVILILLIIIRGWLIYGGSKYLRVGLKGMLVRQEGVGLNGLVEELMNKMKRSKESLFLTD